MDADDLDVAGWNAANPLHPRSGDGRFRSRLASALRHLADQYGDIVDHGTFGDEGDEDATHGMVALHADGRATLSLAEEDGTSVTLIDDLGDDELTELAEAIQAAAESDFGQSGDMFTLDDEVAGAVIGFGTMSDGERYVSIDTNDNGFSLDPQRAAEMAEVLEMIAGRTLWYDPDDMRQTAQLPESETLVRRKAMGSGDTSLFLGLVDTEEGRRVRMGLGGDEDHPLTKFTGGKGAAVADLDADAAAELAEEIEAVFAEAADYRAEWKTANAAERTWSATAQGQEWQRLHDIEWNARPSLYGPDSPRGLTPPPGLDEAQRQRFDELTAARSQAFGGVTDDGEPVTELHEVLTSWGSVPVWGYAEQGAVKLTIGVRPADMDYEDWSRHTGTGGSDDLAADLSERQAKALVGLLHDAFAQAEGEHLVKGAGNVARRADNDRIAREGRKYWTRNPKGLAKWARKAHPWTALYRHLVTKMNPETARRLTSSYFKAVFGYAPSARQGRNPVGKG